MSKRQAALIPEKRPTDAEISILRVLWQRGPSTVRQVHEAVRSDKGRRYTTTLKQLQVMFEKELVIRDERRKSHIYRAAVSEEATQNQLLAHLLESAFGGSKRKLFLRALNHGKTSQAELDDLKALITRLEQRADT